MTRNERIEAHMPRVRSLATWVAKNMSELCEEDELTAIGYLALCEAAETYDEDKSSFWNWAYFRVRGAMYDHMRSISFGSRLKKQYHRRVRWDDPVDGREDMLTVEEVHSFQVSRAVETCYATVDVRGLLEKLLVAAPSEASIVFDKDILGTTQKEIAKDWGICEPRISQKRQKGLRRLRELAHVEDDDLSAFDARKNRQYILEKAPEDAPVH